MTQSIVASDLVYFLHIPKTSGMSLCETLLRVYGAEATAPNLLWDDLVYGQCPLSEKHRVVTGHLGGFFSLWLKRWSRIVTMLRDPIARALSHINHVQREPGHPLHSIAAGLTVGQYCEHPALRKTVDNFQSRYLASLDFALALMPRHSESEPHRPYGSVSVSFENALFSLDRETGLQDAAVRALDAIDAVGICEAHGTSLQVFAKVLGWDIHAAEFELNHAATGQKTLANLSSAEIEALTNLNAIDIQIYEHAIEMFSCLCRDHGLEIHEQERLALTRRGIRGPGHAFRVAS